jgi:ribosomal protein S18 acetylase RimI-like enzyme
MEIRSPQTPQEWESYYDLRYRVLRQPWNQQKGSERDNQEDEAEHFAAFNKQLIIGVGRLDQLNESTCQVRFMAVDPLYQGKSIGKSLMEFILNHSQKKKEKTIILHAREIAVPFYERMGFHVTEKSHLLFGEIQHYLMEKK